MNRLFLSPFRSLLLSLLAASCLGCAAGYHPIEPLKLKYLEPQTIPEMNVDVTYLYDVFALAKNKAYARNEDDFGIYLLGVLITNYSADTLYFPEDFEILADSVPVYSLEREDAVNYLKQDYYATHNSGTEGFWETIVVFIFNGIPNLIIQGSANKKFKNEMETYYLVYSTILPGTEVSGLLALPLDQKVPLVFRKYTEEPEEKNNH